MNKKGNLADSDLSWRGQMIAIFIQPKKTTPLHTIIIHEKSWGCYYNLYTHCYKSPNKVIITIINLFSTFSFTVTKLKTLTMTHCTNL